ncbi:phosphonate C-P lyase system protein PhnG [Hydrogenophaga luteola]|uniref:Phosphonate C-P lyase system protein PhnG n=1 Tax=Hydrogenophaga luteola TaxID=1591122 RepID=A0ABV7VXF7_9BURK
MFHAFDNTGPNRPTPRPEWMALLSRAPLPLLEQALANRADTPLQWLRKPETGLYMVQGRAGGTGERFNLGEMTVTRCALRVGGEDSAVGVAYVMGRNHRQAQLAAMADALLQDPAQHGRIDDTVLQPVRQHLARQQAQRAARAQSTQVNFFTVARESGAADEGDEA